jgi:hypothetical protein
MTVTDTILFIKETSTCHYILVIQTPRLCGDPAFRSRRDSQEQSTIRCREIIQSAEELKENSLPPEVEAQVPLHVWASEKEFRDQMSQPLPKERSKKHDKVPGIDDALLAKIVNQLRSRGIGNFNREKAVVSRIRTVQTPFSSSSLKTTGSRDRVKGSRNSWRLRFRRK